MAEQNNSYKGSIYEPVYNSYKDKSEGSFPFPSHNIDPELKQQSAYCKAWAQAIFYRYIKNRTYFTYNQVGAFQELRSYGAGLQDPNRYKPALLGRKRGTQGGEWERKGWRNVNWEIFSPMPKYIRSLIGKFDSIDHNIIVKALDKKSGDEREDMMWGVWFDKQFPELRNVSAQAGAPMPEPTIVPDNIEELQLLNEMGGFKVKAEVAFKKALDHTEEISEIRELKRKCIEDAINLNVYSFRDYYDPILCKQKYVYVDPAKAVFQYTKKNNFKDASFWGYYDDYNIAELRALTGASEKDLYAVARTWGSYNGIDNNFWSFSDYTSYWDGPNNRYTYDDFKVQVFHAEWFSIDNHYKTKKVKKSGEMVTYNEEFGKTYNTEKRKTQVTGILNVYQCSWVINTDFTFSHGRVPDTPRESKKQPSLSLHAYKLPGKSITETARPILDQIQMAWLQLQNALAKAKPNGWAIEVTSLQNVQMGDENMKPNDLIRMMDQSGNIVYRAVSLQGKVLHQGTPITALPGGIGNFLNESISLINMHLNFLVEFMGLERFGAAGGGEQTATEVNLSVAATNDATKLLYAGWMYMRESAAKNSSSRIASLLKYNKEAQDAYYPVLGDGNIEVLKLSESLTADQWGFSFRARPTAQTIAEINAAAIEAMKVGKNGKPGITFPQYLMLQSLLEDGNVEYCRAVLSRMIAKSEQEAQAITEKNIKMQGEENQKNLVLAEEEKRKTAEFQSTLKIKEIVVEGVMNEQAATNDHIRQAQQKLVDTYLATAQPQTTQQ